MSDPLSIAAIGLEAGGTLLGGIEANRAARAQARVDEENARRTILQGEYDARQTRRDEALASAEMLVASGGNGLMLGGGLADMLAQNAYEREFEILNIRRLATDEAGNLQTSADEARRAGKAALIGSIFGAVGGAIKGASAQRNQKRVDRQMWDERTHRTGGGTVLDKRAPRMRVMGPPF